MAGHDTAPFNLRPWHKTMSRDSTTVYSGKDEAGTESESTPIKNKLEKRNRARERRALSPMLNTRSKKDLSSDFLTVINSGEEKENGPRLPVFFCADTMNN